MSDYYDENGVHQPPRPPERKSRAGLFILAGSIIGLAALSLTGTVITRGEGSAPAATAGPPVVASPFPSPAPGSFGITQAQVDKLGDSIQARYRSGDTEVAQALLDNFMDAHPECVSAVMAGGEGPRREVAKESAEVAEYLLSTAPHPNNYATVITVPSDEGVKAAVLGVSCEGSA
jgi:ABC-type phosphate transport system substrate-binding protein